MRRDTVAGTTTMVGMITDMTMGTITTTITTTITITATQQQTPQPQAPGAPCPSPWWPRGMCTAPTALPVGGFSYSEGLESAIENAGLASETAVGEWLLDQLHITQARGDMALVAKAASAW